MDTKKKMILAASLLVLWAGLAVWQWRSMQEPARVPLTNVGGRPSVGQQAATGRTGLRVHLDWLTSRGLQSQTTFTVHRNIFTVLRSDGTFMAGNEPVSMNQPGSASAETATQQEDTSDLEQYHYLGFLRVGEGRRENKDIAVLKKDDEVLVLKVGDHVDHHLILKAINSESVTIRDTGTHMDQTVLLSEKSTEESIGQE